MEISQLKKYFQLFKGIFITINGNSEQILEENVPIYDLPFQEHTKEGIEGRHNENEYDLFSLDNFER